jgi:predicted DNA-binding protein (MmcQ/YjbR family)
MNVEQLRKTCLSFPGTTEQIQWGDDLLFKVGGKMFAITPLIPARVVLSFKVTDENFAELTERPGIIPAPYLARAKWVALESRDALGIPELEPLLRESYELVVAKLPRKLQEKVRKAPRSVARSRSRPTGKAHAGKRRRRQPRLRREGPRSER